MKVYEVLVLPQAQDEANAIRRYQNAESLERGRRFMAAWLACLENLRTDPLYQKRKGSFRHVNLHKLPYRVVFGVSDTKVMVYQVRHTSRKAHSKFGP